MFVSKYKTVPLADKTIVLGYVSKFNRRLGTVSSIPVKVGTVVAIDEMY